MEVDYQKCDRIWQRVSPELNPYPEVRAEQKPKKQLALPAAPDRNCCMGEASMGELETIRGFLRDEIANAQIYRYLAVLAPSQEGRRLMRRLASDATARVKTLQSAYYLITGETYRVAVVVPPQPKLPWCEQLRGRYHEEVCDGFNYQRAADKTADVCLKKLMHELSAGKYRGAEQLRQHIARAL